MSRKTIITIISLILMATPVWASENLSQKLKGYILLQIESNGEAWYVNPVNLDRYYLGRPSDAFQIMQKLGTGISNADLNKIPIGLILTSSKDSDGDGLPDTLEKAIGTNPNLKDTDGDGYDDKIEIENNYNPLGGGKLSIDENFAKKNAGRIFLQVENNGEAWYVDPKDLKRYFLGRPADAFAIMRQLGLGISNKNLSEISINYLSELNNQVDTSPNTNTPTIPISNNLASSSPDQIFQGATNAILKSENEKALDYFATSTQPAIKYTLNFLDPNGRLTLGNIMAGSKVTSSNDSEVVYSNDVYFAMGGYKVRVSFHIKKQTDGSWKLTNL